MDKTSWQKNTAGAKIQKECVRKSHHVLPQKVKSFSREDDLYWGPICTGADAAEGRGFSSVIKPEEKSDLIEK